MIVVYIFSSSCLPANWPLLGWHPWVPPYLLVLIFLLLPKNISCFLREFSPPAPLWVRLPLGHSNELRVFSTRTPSGWHKERQWWVKTMKMNLRAGGTEGISRGRKMGRSPPCALPASLRARENTASLWGSGGFHSKPETSLSLKCFLGKGKS